MLISTFVSIHIIERSIVIRNFYFNVYMLIIDALIITIDGQIKRENLVCREKLQVFKLWREIKK